MFVLAHFCSWRGPLLSISNSARYCALLRPCGGYGTLCFLVGGDFGSPSFAILFLNWLAVGVCQGVHACVAIAVVRIQFPVANRN